jgi:stress response protein YsnF
MGHDVDMHTGRGGKLGVGEGREESVRIPVRQEEIAVGKESVDTGKGVRVTTTVHERPETVHEVLRREHVEVRRVPVDRIVPAGEAPQPRHEGNTLVIPVVEEILVVEKRLRVREEIHVTTTTHDEPVSETVHLKSEDVSIQRFDDNQTGERGATPAT